MQHSIGVRVESHRGRRGARRSRRLHGPPKYLLVPEMHAVEDADRHHPAGRGRVGYLGEGMVGPHGHAAPGKTTNGRARSPVALVDSEQTAAAVDAKAPGRHIPQFVAVLRQTDLAPRSIGGWG